VAVKAVGSWEHLTYSVGHSGLGDIKITIYLPCFEFSRCTILHTLATGSCKCKHNKLVWFVPTFLLLWYQIWEVLYVLDLSVALTFFNSHRLHTISHLDLLVSSRAHTHTHTHTLFFWRWNPTRVMASSFLRFSTSHTR
jgi:hypothetical protein